MAIHQLKGTQMLPARLEEVWDFISSPENLAKITPEHMGFVIKTPGLPPKIFPGLMIAYTVKPVLGIPLTWLTEITHVHEGRYFVDEQRVGPYALWHHEHHIKEVEGGVLMEDLVTYRLPLGVLGNLAHGLFVKQQLAKIFAYREQALEERFGAWPIQA